MFEDKRTAYQQRGIIKFLRDVKKLDCTDICKLIEEYSVDELRYHYNISDDDLNWFWNQVC